MKKTMYIFFVCIISSKRTFYFHFVCCLGFLQGTLKEVWCYFTGTPNHYQVLIVIIRNHTSYIEPLLLYSLTTVCFFICVNPLFLCANSMHTLFLKQILFTCQDPAYMSAPKCFMLQSWKPCHPLCPSCVLMSLTAQILCCYSTISSSLNGSFIKHLFPI